MEQRFGMTAKSHAQLIEATKREVMAAGFDWETCDPDVIHQCAHYCIDPQMSGEEAQDLACHVADHIMTERIAKEHGVSHLRVKLVDALAAASERQTVSLGLAKSLRHTSGPEWTMFTDSAVRSTAAVGIDFSPEEAIAYVIADIALPGSFFLMMDCPDGQEVVGTYTSFAEALAAARAWIQEGKEESGEV